jgi:hypothetical protein
MKDVHGLASTGSAPSRLLLHRREVLAGAAALGLSTFAGSRAMAQTQTRGGTLRVGLIGGGASVDTLDPTAETLSPELAQSARQLRFSKLAD